VSDTRPLFIPVVLGTVRRGRKSGHVARFVHGELSKRAGVETELIDIRGLDVSASDEGAGARDERFTAAAARADALVLVVPEYNHGYPGLLKHALDTNLKEYIHKAVGVCGVSAGPFGGTRVVENLLPVLRELGLVAIFWDVNFSSVQKAFDAEGNLTDAAYVQRLEKFFKELVWMAKVLRHGREHVALEEG
jgi:NAD(P)H-dependent FMN reductase